MKRIFFALLGVLLLGHNSDSIAQAWTPVQGFTNCPGTVLGSFTRGAYGVGAITLNYTGGNGGIYPSMTVNSQGVTGLTAHLTGGALNKGNGYLYFLVTGYPSSGGKASFPFTFGAATCKMIISVDSAIPTVTDFTNCPGTSTGSLANGVQAGNVSITLNYTGGNGLAYPTTSIASAGVEGLTATLNAGKLNKGSGSLQFTISGKAAGIGTVTFPVSFGGATCNMRIKAGPGPIPGVITSWSCPGLTGPQYEANFTTTFKIAYNASNGGYIPTQALYTGYGLTVMVNEVTLSPAGGTLQLWVYGTPTIPDAVPMPITIGGQSCTLNYRNGKVY